MRVRLLAPSASHVIAGATSRLNTPPTGSPLGREVLGDCYIEDVTTKTRSIVEHGIEGEEDAESNSHSEG